MFWGERFRRKLTLVVLILADLRIMTGYMSQILAQMLQDY